MKTYRIKQLSFDTVMGYKAKTRRRFITARKHLDTSQDNVISFHYNLEDVYKVMVWENTTKKSRCLYEGGSIQKALQTYNTNL